MKIFKKINFKNLDTSVFFLGCVAISLIIIVYCIGGNLFALGKEMVSSTIESAKPDEKAQKIFTDMYEYAEKQVKPTVDEFSRKINEISEKEQSGTYQSSKDDTVTLKRVVDGDTYLVDINGTETKVRLIGVDTPESVAPDNYYKENTESGSLISDIVKDYLKEGDKLTIEYDIGRTDTYGRTLAYLYFPSGTMIQEWLLQNGYAQVMTIQPNSKYADKFVELEKQAMANKLGIWAD